MWNIILNECNTYTDKNSVPGSSSDNEDSDSSNKFYNNLTKSFHSYTLESDSAENDTSVSNTAVVEPLTYLNSKKKHLYLLMRFQYC